MKQLIDQQGLFEDLCSGSCDAFARFYDANIDALYNYGKALTTDKDLVMDCIHDVFLKMYQRRAEFASIENLKAYFFISLKNRIFDEMRRDARLSDTSLEQYTQSDGANVEENLIGEERAFSISFALLQLVSKLTSRQREAITLYYIEGKTYEDICRIMSLNYQSVRNLMCRALSRLRGLADVCVVDSIL